MRNSPKNALNSTGIARRLRDYSLFHKHRDAIYRPPISFVVAAEGKKKRETEKCSEQNMCRAGGDERPRGLEPNYYSRSLNARMVLNMVRAALIREREFRRVRAPACITGDKSRRAARGERIPRYRRSKMRSKNCRQFELLIRTVRESYLGRSSA